MEVRLIQPVFSFAARWARKAARKAADSLSLFKVVARSHAVCRSIAASIPGQCLFEKFQTYFRNSQSIFSGQPGAMSGLTCP
jgi:hypothetical protein